MKKSQGVLRAATGVLLVGAALAVLPSTSVAAPPPAPNYQCSTAAKPRAGAVKIMIAGDSITNGSAGDYTWPYRLWQDQHGRGAKVDFVGGFKGTIDVDAGTNNSRAYLDCNFDQDKEARPSTKLWTGVKGRIGLGSPVPASSDPTRPSYPGQTSWIRGATKRFKPQILVLFAGANDLFLTEGEPIPDTSELGVAKFVIAKLKYVIAQARLGNPGIDIVLTTVPTYTATSRYNRYNAMLPAVVKQLNTKSQRVVLATIPSWGDGSWDGAHPNSVGEVRIAAAIDDKLRAINPALLARPKVLAKPPIGPRFPAVLTRGAVASTSVALSWKFPPGADRAIIYYRKAGSSTWIKDADLVKTSLRKFYPNEGTQTCDTRCTAWTVTGLTKGTQYQFHVRIGKGRSIGVPLSNVVSATTSGGGIFG